MNIGTFKALLAKSGISSKISDVEPLINGDNVVATTLTSAALQQLQNEAVSGSTIVLRPGRYIMDASLVIDKPLRIIGVPGHTELWAASDGFSIMVTNGTISGDIFVYGVKLYGYADRNPVLQSGLRGCQLQCSGRLTLEKVEAKYLRNMGLTGKAREIYIKDCYVEKSLRDAINVSGSQKTWITDNEIFGAGDDAIAVHVEAAPTSPPYRREYEVHVEGNTIRMAQGIKVLGARKANVSRNRMDMVKAYGVYIAADSSYGEGFSSMRDIVVSENIIKNIINPLDLGGSSNLQTGIWLSGKNQLGSIALNPGGKLPGEFDLVSMTWTRPEGLDTMFGGVVGSDTTQIDNSAPIAGMRNVKIINNIITQDLPASASISALGFGAGWHTSGEIDPAISFIEKGEGIRLQGSMENVEIKGNTLRGLSTGGSLGQWPIAQDLSRWRDIDIVDNKFIDIKNLAWNFSQNQADTTFTNFYVARNSITMDPYLSDPDRSTSGYWVNNSNQTRRAWGITNTRGIVFDENRYRQTRNAFSGSNGFYIHKRPIYYAHAVDNRDTDHTGVHTFSDALYGTLVTEVSNPLNGAYGRIYYSVDFYAAYSSTIPIAGWYPKGCFVHNSSPTVANGKVLLGWIRLTSGTGHVDGVDWSASYATIS